MGGNERLSGVNPTVSPLRNGSFLFRPEQNPDVSGLDLNVCVRYLFPDSSHLLGPNFLDFKL